MSMHPEPPQRAQRSLNEVGLLVQVPWVNCNVCPCCATPNMLGGALTAGTGPVTCGAVMIPVGAEKAVLLGRAALLAVSATSIVEPTSPAVKVYVWVVTPVLTQPV